ncbi:MAG: transcriptional repressor LexA [Alphaproteobacteria bacterium]|nr:transcriptional repressor LexA [Alphaproteobacteria bacterium]
MLTKKQRDLLFFIHRSIQSDGICPSYEEMCSFLGLHSKSGIHRLINALEQRGFIRRLPNKARAVEILTLPEERCPTRQIKTMASKIKTVVNDNAVDIPLYGKIACGTPIEAVCNPDTVCVPSHMMGRGEHYALTVEGDSMKNVGIMDGDTVIIKRTETAPNGTIVVALVDGYEVTLKRIHVQGNQIALIPENESYETRIFDADRVEVQGQLVGLLRQYH